MDPQILDRENIMAEQRDSGTSEVRTIGEKEPAPEYTSPARPSVETGKLCAYNETRERFLSGDVETADFPRSSLDGQVIAFTPGSGAALWIVPFRDISPTNVRTPIDLLYLDGNCVVLDAVDSFPVGRVSPSSSPRPASVLAVPVRTIASGGARPGDQLVLCAPEEMKRRLQLLADARITTQAEESTAPGISTKSVLDRPTPKEAGPVLKWDDHPRPEPSSEGVPSDSPHVVMFPSLEQAPSSGLVEPAQTATRVRKNWIQRLFSPNPPEPRNAPRESLPWLVAYFFTGGAPVAQAVRDISATGLYIYTEERWYVGTVVRLTLTDRQRPSADRSIALNAQVVRLGNDGVGLEFMLQDKKDVRRGTNPDPDSPSVSKVQLKEFLELLRSGSS